MRLVVVGDELAAGAGDPKGLGWVGRVAARTHTPVPATFLTLAVPGETSSALGVPLGGGGRPTVLRGQRQPARGRPWAARTSDANLSLARSRLNLANVLDVAESRRVPTFVVGPPPGRSEDSDRIEDLSAAYADVANRRRVPYVDTFTPLVTHEQWLGDLAAGDGLLPGQAGYGMMAWLVLHTGWHAWLGLPDDAA